MMLTFLTDLADQTIVLPLTAVIGLTLLLLGRPTLATAWTRTVSGVLLLMLFLKLVLYVIKTVEPGFNLERVGFISPSGHTAAAACVYGALAGLALRLRPAWLMPFIAAAVIGATRITLGDHSFCEVLVGGAVGVLGGRRIVEASDADRCSPPPAALPLVTIPIVVGLHGQHLPAEELIRSGATTLAHFLVGR